MPIKTLGQTAAVWQQLAGGDWGVGANWSLGFVPHNGVPTVYDQYTATLPDLGQPYTVTSTSGWVDELDLIGNGTELLVGGQLHVGGTIDIGTGATLNLATGRISSARIAGAGQFVLSDDINGTAPVLSQVELATTLTGTSPAGRALRIEQGLTFDNGLIDISASQPVLTIYGSQAIGGSGEIHLHSTGLRSEVYLAGPTNALLDIDVGPDITIRATGAQLRMYMQNIAMRFDNFGTLWADGADFSVEKYSQFYNHGTIRISDGARFYAALAPNAPLGNVELEEGRLEVRGSSSSAVVVDQPLMIPTGGIVDFYRPWNNVAGIHVAGGTLNLRSSSAAPGAITYDGGTLAILFNTTASYIASLGSDTNRVIRPGSAVDLEEGTFDLANVPGTWDISYATFSNGRLQNSNGSLTLDSGPSGTGYATMNSVTIDVPLELMNGRLLLTNGTQVLQNLTVEEDGWLSAITGWSVDPNAAINVNGGHLELAEINESLERIHMNGGTVRLNIATDINQLPGQVPPTPDVVEVGGNFDLLGQTVDLAALPWQYVQALGMLQNGHIVTGSPARSLRVTTGDLDNVVLEADLEWNNHGGIIFNSTLEGVEIRGNVSRYLVIVDSTFNDVVANVGLSVFQGTLNLHNFSTNSFLDVGGLGALAFDGAETIAGTGRITLRGEGTSDHIQALSGPLTIGEGVTLEGTTFQTPQRINATGQAIIVEGTLKATRSSSRYPDPHALQVVAESIAVNGTLSLFHAHMTAEATELVFGHDAVTEIFLGPTDVSVERLNVTGGMIVDGDLNIVIDEVWNPMVGQLVPLIVAGDRSGEFAQISVTGLGAHLGMQLVYSDTSVMAQVVPLLPGDFDADGDVDGRDLLAWQRDPGLGELADWQENYDTVTPDLGAISVPEPASAGMAGVILMVAIACRRKSAAFTAR
jgi:hypothetical protein